MRLLRKNCAWTARVFFNVATACRMLTKISENIMTMQCFSRVATLDPKCCHVRHFLPEKLFGASSWIEGLNIETVGQCAPKKKARMIKVKPSGSRTSTTTLREGAPPLAQSFVRCFQIGFKLCRGLYSVDLGERSQMSFFFFANLASIQPRASPVKFARSPRTDPSDPRISTPHDHAASMVWLIVAHA